MLIAGGGGFDAANNVTLFDTLHGGAGVDRLGSSPDDKRRLISVEILF